VANAGRNIELKLKKIYPQIVKTRNAKLKNNQGAYRAWMPIYITRQKSKKSKILWMS